MYSGTWHYFGYQAIVLYYCNSRFCDVRPSRHLWPLLPPGKEIDSKLPPIYIICSVVKCYVINILSGLVKFENKIYYKLCGKNICPFCVTSVAHIQIPIVADQCRFQLIGLFHEIDIIVIIYYCRKKCGPKYNSL